MGGALMATGIRRWIGRRRRGDAALVTTVRAPKGDPDGEAVYVGTTRSESHRVVAGALFGRGDCRYWIEPGRLLFQRAAGPVIALGGICQVGLAGAHAGQVLAPNRIAIVTWGLGDGDLDTGFGFADAKHAELFADQVAAAVGLSPERGPHAGA